MRTNVDLNDKLVNEAIKLTKIDRKKDLIEFALKELVSSQKRKKIREYRGKLFWEGNLDEMRKL